jgi:RNA polymerase sigma factor (TIGR02999 family)
VTKQEDLLPLIAEATQESRVELNAVIPMLYEEMRRLAKRALRNERPGHTLSTTGLAHEAYLELSRIRNVQWKSRAHFLGVCARVIRHVLVDYAVRRKAEKRGGGVDPLPLEEASMVGERLPESWVDLHEALERLASLEERHARVVECRFFAGMSVEETAEALGVAPATVKRDWALARAWLNQELSR